MTEFIKGASGAQKQHTPVEAANTLRSQMTARVLLLTSRGEIGGLADQTNKLKSVYFDNTPVMNADGSVNFPNVQVDERYGLPSQSIMDGYPSASNSINVGTKVTTTAPATYTTSVATIDAVRVTIQFPALFKQETNGDTNGTSVQFKISRAVGAGAYSVYNTYTVNDKCVSPSTLDYYVPRPTGSSGVWSVKVERITADNSLTTLANDIYLQIATEIQLAQLPYNGYGYLGVAAQAQSTGANFPTISVDTYGRKIKVPSNYTVSTRTYSGVWDGTFSATKQVCDNPAWVLYDILTDVNAGMGSIISESDIDKYSFYDAAVYCDGLVPTASGVGTEPRYTFNYQFLGDQQDAWTFIQNIAAVFGAVVYTSGNKVRLVQDRPTTATRLITNSNVVDGMFEYTSAQRSQRATACVVYWNDPAQNWLSVPCRYQDDGAVSKYGLFTKEITGFGITSEGQALRLAKWTVDTSINNTDAAVFKVGFNNAGMEPGEVLKVMDTNYAQVMNEAKVASSTSTSITLDRTVTVTAGNTIDVIGSDGVTLYTCVLTNTGTVAVLNNAGNSVSLLAGADGTPAYTYYALTNTLTFDTPISVSANADVIITGSVSPRPFKVTSIKEDSPGVYTVSAVQYDANKFGRVDSTPTGLTPIYQAQPSLTVVSPVVGITFSEESYIDVDSTAKRNIVAKWTPVSGQFVTNYKAYWTKNNNAISSQDTVQQNARLAVDTDGTYTVTVYAFNANGVRSAPASASYTVTLTAPSAGSALSPITSLIVKGGGTSFTGQDCSVVWSDPNTNGGAVVAGYQVQVCDASTPTTVYRTEFVKTAAYTYDFTKQGVDNPGAPKRSFIISVQVKDTYGRLSTATAVTFSNPAPAAPSNLVVTPGLGSVSVNWDGSTDADYVSTYVWMSTTSGFTQSAANLVSTSTASFYTRTDLTQGATYYFRVAHFDKFGGAKDGTGLNVSAPASGTTLALGISKGTTLPGSASEGDLFQNTTDGKLYRYHSGAWTAAVPTTDLSGVLTTAQIADASLTTAKFASAIEPVTIVSSVPGTKSTNVIFNSTDGKQYRWNGTAYVATVATVDLSGTVTGTQIAASTITGGNIAANTITGSNIAANTITAGLIQAGAISTTQLAAGSVTSTIIAANTITSSNIAANTIVSGNIAANTITGGNIAASTITSSNIAANTIVAGNISAGTITAAQIAANTIGASQLITGSAIITNTAQMSNAVITTAAIADLAVSSLKLANQSVFVPVTSSATGVNISNTTADVSITSVAITLDSTFNTTSNPTAGVSVIATVNMVTGLSSTSSAFNYKTTNYFTLYRDSTPIATKTTYVTNRCSAGDALDDGRDIVFEVFDQPGPGTFTYSVQGHSTRNSSILVTTVGANILCLGAKK